MSTLLDTRRPPRTVALVSEDTSGPPDEAYVSYSQHLGQALRHRSRVLELPLDVRGGAGAPGGSGMGWKAKLGDLRRLYGLARQAQAQGADTLLYASRSSCTLPALIRARALKQGAPGAQVVLIALQPRDLSRPRRWLARGLWPDRLLVGTVAERDLLRRSGARSDLVFGGVDVSRFRPPRGDTERAELRRRWGLPAGDRLVLHVGHAMRGRNLGALAPLTGLAGVTLVVVLSSRSEPEAETEVDDLAARGAIVLRGYLPQVEEVYRASDCYVLPTASTDNVVALPLSVIEALASDLPVVARGVGALPDTFGDQPAVRLVENDRELAAGVLSQLRDRPTARQLALPFSWEAQAERILSLRDGEPFSV